MYSILSNWQEEKNHKYKKVNPSELCTHSQVFPPCSDQQLCTGTKATKEQYKQKHKYKLRFTCNPLA